VQPTTAGHYLETEVMTASPQRLQYLLIEGAIRAIERGRSQWHEKRDEEACESLIRAQEIVTQILTGLNREAGQPLVRKVASIYLYVFRTLSEAQLRRDEEKLDDVLRVLQTERQTWRMLCEKLGAAAAGESESATAGLSEPDASSGRPPIVHPKGALPEGTSTGFSVEA